MLIRLHERLLQVAWKDCFDDGARLVCMLL